MNKSRRHNRQRRINKRLKLAAWRKANPMKYAYQTLKDNAKRRHKEFTLSFEFFEKWCYKYKYLDKKGISRDGYGIDRIKEEYGYHEWNIQIMKNPDNVTKYKVYDLERRTAMTVTNKKVVNGENYF